MKHLLGIVFGGLLLLSAAPAADSPASAELLAESLPLVDSWVPAVFPTGLPADVRHGDALVRIIVDETGVVTASRVVGAAGPEFGEAALAAVRQWKFKPGVEFGKRAAMCLDVPFEFFAGPPKKPGLLPPQHLLPKPAARTRATVVDTPLGEFPDSLRGRGLRGIVTFACLVGPDGRPVELRVLRASHVDFVLPTLAAYQRWQFNPAKQGDLPVRAETQGEVEFGESPALTRAQALAANGITAPDGAVPDNRPHPLALADPVWPYDLLIKGEGGSASVRFTVTANGYAKDVKVHEATHPDLGAALAAAAETWVFDPAQADGRGVEVALMKRMEFRPVPLASKDENDPLSRAVLLARTNALTGGADLDERLTPLYRIAPAPPAGEKKAGEAVVEFVVDRDGRVRLPNVISATAPEFGWSAATAISQWVFKAPTRAGKPTEVKVRLPMKF